MKKALLIGLLLLTGCSSDKRGYFYVASTPCGYKVASDTEDEITRYYTACTTVEDARVIADRLNDSIPHNMMPHTHY